MDTRSKTQGIVADVLDSSATKATKEVLVDPAEGTSTGSQDGDKSPKTAAAEERPKATSPDPNCSICLGKMENKSFTDSCFHTFCFVCLLEWSKVKAVCPLCKQPFKSIIHNVRSFEDYDQYHLRNEEQSQNEAESRRFRFHSTMTSERWWEQQLHEQQRQLALLRRPSRMTLATQWRRQRQAATSGYRRRIYANSTRVSEVRSASGRTMRYREVSPQFYQENPACTHRLVPWLNRELLVLLNNHEDHLQFVLELILDLIKRFDILSEEFFQHIQPFTGRRTGHFVHEFHSFARSPYDMFAYDQRAFYDESAEQQQQPVHTIDSSDDSSDIVSPDNPDDDPDIIVVSSSQPTSALADEATTSQDHPYSSMFGLTAGFAPTSTTFMNMGLAPLLDRVHSFLSAIDNQPPSQSGWDSPTAGPSTMWSPPIEVPSSTSNSATTSTESAVVSTSMAAITLKKETPDSHSSDSESSDVIVVGYEKPWDERSAVDVSTTDDEAALNRALEREMRERKKRRQKSGHHRGDHSRSERDARRERSHRSEKHNLPKGYRISSSKSPSKSPTRHHSGSHRSRSRDRDRITSKRNRSRSREVERRRDHGHQSYSSTSYRDRHREHSHKRQRHSRSRSKSRSRDSRRVHSSSYSSRHHRSRSRSVELVFRRKHRDKSAEKQVSKERRKRRRSRDRKKHHNTEKIDLASQKKSVPRSVGSNSPSSINGRSHKVSTTSPASRCDETEDQRQSYKKNPTGHKTSSKSAHKSSRTDHGHSSRGSYEDRTTMAGRPAEPSHGHSSRNKHEKTDKTSPDSPPADTAIEHHNHQESNSESSGTTKDHSHEKKKHESQQVDKHELFQVSDDEDDELIIDDDNDEGNISDGIQDISSDSDICEVTSRSVEPNQAPFPDVRQGLDPNLTNAELDEITAIAHAIVQSRAPSNPSNQSAWSHYNSAATAQPVFPGDTQARANINAYYASSERSGYPREGDSVLGGSLHAPRTGNPLYDNRDVSRGFYKENMQHRETSKKPPESTSSAQEPAKTDHGAQDVTDLAHEATTDDEDDPSS